MKKRISFLLLLLALCFLGQRLSAQSLIICFDEKCEVQINGSTNISDYQCSLDQLPEKDTLEVYSYTKNGLFYLENAIVNLPTRHFLCDNKVMTDDFLEALKADEFPQISITFDYFKLEKPLHEQPIQNNVWVKYSITLAGVKKDFYTKYEEVKLEEDILFLKGTLKVKMTDFGIKPPTALLGAIKADDAITMRFNVRFCISH